MPTEIPNGWRAKEKRVHERSIRSRLLFLAGLFLALFVLVTILSWPAHAQGAPKLHEHQSTKRPKLDPGDYGYLHDHFHRYYEKLQRKDTDGKLHSCCNGDECRVTEALQDATELQKLAGYDRQVKVNGKWCPIRLKDTQITFTEEQRALAKNDEGFREFLSFTHVCSPPELWMDYRTRNPNGCVRIYCVIEGGDKN